MIRYIHLLIFLFPSVMLHASVVDSVFAVKNKSVDPPSNAIEFFEEGLLPSAGITDSAQFYIVKARAVISKIWDAQAFLSRLDETALFELPVGISKMIGGLEYTVSVASMKLMSSYTELEMCMEFTIDRRMERHNG